MIDPTVADRLIRLRTLHQRAMAAAADTARDEQRNEKCR